MNNSCCSIKQGKVILNYLIFEQILGRGAFGEVWQVHNKKDNEKYACKIEPKSTSQNLLSNEIKILSKLSGSAHFPKIHIFGSDSKNNYVVLDMYNGDLENYRWRKGGTLSQQVVMQMAYQMIDILEDLHSHGFIHRDVKPENIALKDSHPQNLYLIDFGLSKQYISKNGTHISCSYTKGLTGTIRFASANALYGLTQSRRDDLESLFYTLIYLIKGSLPWVQHYQTKEIKKQHTLNFKMMLVPEELEEWNGIYNGFFELFNYSRKLSFNEKPDYLYLKSLFKGARYSYFSTSGDEQIQEITSDDRKNRMHLQLTVLVPSSIQFSQNLIDHNSSSGDLSEANEDGITITKIQKMSSEYLNARKPLSS